jgi:Cdc6-like AAA superfamily ATPase
MEKRVRSRFTERELHLTKVTLEEMHKIILQRLTIPLPDEGGAGVGVIARGGNDAVAELSVEDINVWNTHVENLMEVSDGA